jgi:hypothetical protein
MQWELGSGDDGHVEGQVTYTHPEVAGLSKPSSDMGMFLSDSQYSFTLEVYANGTPAPSVVTKEVDMVVAAPFLLARPDFSETEEVKGIRLHHCCSWYGLLERDKRSLERGSGPERDNRSQERGSNEGSTYFQPDTCIGQQALGV